MSLSPNSAVSLDRKRQAVHIQLADLLLIQLSNYRWSWRGMVVTGVAAPLMTLVAVGLPAKQYGTDALAYVLVGSIVLSLMFQIMNQVAHNFSFMKAMGMLDYFATLPVYRFLLIIATVLAFLLMAVPSLLVTLVFGVLVLGVPLQISPLALVVIPLCALPLAGIGALIGLTAPSPQEVGPFTLLLTIVLLFLGPVVLPPVTLPDWLLALGHVSPSGYAASALRQAMVGPVTGRLWLDLAVLAGLAAAVLWAVGRKITWQPR
ncbi:ABC transporter permease [Sinosporangium siamense]|uniref:Transport permease protein n=1 Tax=Sinosporangium siamense TaxID=1367973 RepID=A0A919VB23_9ACTN|nr:ABC transporter permease [Sinosporangium siamense]GII96032.1 hypothetical protein Ssi02_62630 [Sinosporangium siamense]